MKRKAIFYIVIILIIGIVIFPYFTPLNRAYNPSKKFFKQFGTTWKSNDPEMKIVVYKENDPNYQNGAANGTIKIGNEVINVELFYADAGVIMFRNIDENRKGVKEGYFFTEINFIMGDCDFSRKKLEIKVIRSIVDEIKVGDEIVLYRQD